ncbi:MAG: hypothetical protein MJ094_05295 [Saccharofermentans sp.]|nr:hypothetical protein [Saccharofermentans sp.]
MNNIDPVIKKETKFIALVVLILSALMQAVFLIIGLWDLPVLFGNILGGVVGILNFFFMGLGLQSALKKETADAKQTAKFSQTMRNLMIVVTIVIAVFVSWFNLASTAIAIFFPTIGVFVKAFVINKKGGNKE